MPTKTMKTRAKAAPRVLSREATLADLIITLDPPIQAAKAPAKKQKAARDMLLELLSVIAAPEDELTARGTLGEVTFTAASEATACTDLRRVHELLGDDAFYELATVSIGDLKEALTALQL